jgi:hypothetical protein
MERKGAEGKEPKYNRLLIAAGIVAATVSGPAAVFLLGIAYLRDKTSKK